MLPRIETETNLTVYCFKNVAIKLPFDNADILGWLFTLTKHFTETKSMSF